MTGDIIALAGNPNVGKSSLFNRLTGKSRHTGNWTGKTVDTAFAPCKNRDFPLVFADLPGTYSLTPKSQEEEISGDFLIFEKPKCTVVVVDATCLLRTALILFEVLEITKNVVLCINFADRARAFETDTLRLSARLGIPVVEISARTKSGLDRLLDAISGFCTPVGVALPVYSPEIEAAIKKLSVFFENDRDLSKRWLAIRLLQGDFALFERIKKTWDLDFLSNDGIFEVLDEIGIEQEKLRDLISTERVNWAKKVISPCQRKTQKSRDFAADRVLMGKWSGTLVMVVLLLFIFWLTLFGANSVSDLLSGVLLRLENGIFRLMTAWNLPDWVVNPVCFGVLHVLFRVISVMTPPMLIFFPLFTFLEELGYLPRVAFNLDRHFQKCASCGKQAYSMCMGIGCNAVGVTAARIIDSKRERTLAILTNCLVPCNGKFPALTSIVSMFVIFSAPSATRSVLGAAILAGIVVFSVAVTFLVTKILSKTLFRGKAEPFILELPSYKFPKLSGIFAKSFVERGVLLICRAAVVAAPCGLVVWCLANFSIGDKTLYLAASEFLEPIGRFMGLDGTILLSFVLGLPANEIVIPLILMGYSGLSTIGNEAGLEAIKEVLLANGWNTITAVNTVIFMIFHWPCSTTLHAVKRETKSARLTFLAAIIPTAIGFFLCVIVNLIF